jgi:hypothetical protein
MFPYFSLSKRITKTRLTETFKKNSKNFPKKEGCSKKIQKIFPKKKDF